MLSTTNFLEAVGFVELHGREGCINIDARRPGGDGVRFGQSEQSGADPAPGGYASHINGCPVLRFIDAMRRKTQDRTFAIDRTERDEEGFPTLHRPHVQVGREPRAPLVNDVRRIEPRADRTNRITMRRGAP